ncbi:uncharacterized protein [Linepithema humile]|uniref:uncharacterized protein n=1 Tax=Linepithema humile TaxID=83485 RepID=UPI0006237FC1|nr:PREDICTED: zinc finger protein 33A-like [Linepithema humile]XP_012219583.1 PREDICTED: zinc finger protein 33A-like [Linepithema humile]XP_012219590.1 PREDICTED: zinc finger protein 33A-like [Linepithema humile]
MSNSEINKSDHNYSESEYSQHIPSVDSDTINSGSMMTMPIVGQIKDIDQLKKIAPRVRLQDTKRLNELAKISSLSNNNDKTQQSKASTPKTTAQELKKYCRTCAGLKVPLVDIFGEKGIQMRLSQQIRHLKVIHPYDNLSTQMCMDCICDLKMSYKFFMQIKKAEMKLKSMQVNLTTKDMEIELINESSPTKREEQSSCSGKESATSYGNQENFHSSEAKQESPMIQQNRSLSPSTKQENQLDLGNQKDVPKICAIFSLNNKSKVDSEETEDVQTGGGIFEEMIEGEDEESIEEFDPEDPAFQEDEEESEKSSAAVYKYDMMAKSYVRMDESEAVSMKSTVSQISESEGEKDGVRQPNILKRRLLMPSMVTKSRGEDEVQSGIESSPKDCKVQKLDLNNPLNVNSTPEEDGIMYVTVKGSKPNEILLVKVKKMEKSLETKRSVASADVKPVERILKRYDTLTSKDYSSRRSDAREQIIEEQIEEYKKKREKIFGDKSVLNFTPNDSRKETQEEEISIKIDPEKIEEEPIILQEENEEKEDEKIDIDEILIEDKETEKINDDTEEDFSKLSRLKLKLVSEETKRKKESLQKELDESYNEGKLEKLVRILGEDKNLQEFQDYLKQRKIVLTRLKDEDVISLYEDHFSTSLKSSSKLLPDFIETSLLTDPFVEERYLECDYCLETFTNSDTLEEHLKSHDYRMLHYCEDCGEEFPTNKGKKSHNVICVRKLICKYCDIILDSRRKKRQHEQKHIDALYGQLCEVCGERFKHQGTLDQHIKTQHTTLEKIYQCPKCPKKFALKQKLSFHLKSVHTTLRAYLCEDCGADFKNPASLRHHRIRKHQPVGNKRECPVCRKLVPFYSLSKHMHTHKAYSIQCPHCDKMFKNSSTLKQHVRIHEDQRQYRCDTCGVGFNRRDGLRLHMRVHEKTGSRGLKECSCQVCGEKFPNHSTLVIHRNREHKDGRQYTCHICNRSMISTRSLEWHMSHIHNESMPGITRDESGLHDKRRVSCYHCNKTFKTEMILRTHIKNTHMEKDPMKCTDCDSSFTSEVRLRHHMMITHNRLEGTLECPRCPKRFVNQLRLKTHMISHSEERPYTCEICGFNLKTKIQLIKHHQNRHSNERPLQCRYCPWRCKQVSALVCHERTHTNERPYTCSVCEQRFKYLGDKNKHERRHESLGGSGFKRIVHERNIKPKVRTEESSGSEQEESVKDINQHDIHQEVAEDQEDQEQIVKFESQEEYEQVYEQEYEETSREASEATEVIMNMEDSNVYTEEVTADNIESGTEIIANEIITNDILQSGAAVMHLQRQDNSGKIQVIPVMLSLPDLSDANAEVNLATASIMYNN